MDWGHALDVLYRGEKVRRAGWNGKGMHVFLFSKSNFCIKNDDRSQDFPLDDESAGTIQHIGFEDGGHFYPIADFILLKTAQGTCIPWVTSQADVLADDWEAA